MDFMKAFVFLLALLVTPVYAFAGNFVQGLPDGSYKGKLRGQEKGGVNFLVKSYPGCDGCFIAVALDADDIFDRKVQLVAYSGLPIERTTVDGKETSTRYSLTPIGVDADGELTLPNENPSLVLNIKSGVGTTNAEFTITSAQSGNTLGFNSSMVFLWSRQSPFDIIDPPSGEYREPWGSKVQATIGMVSTSPEDHSKSARISWMGNIRKTGGDFLLKEKMPNVYTFNAVSYLAEGERLKDIPTYIVMFVKRHGKEHFLMVNPVDSRDVSCLYLK
jgi:hypothetical protein